jgi:hypothetical protein
MADDLLKGRLDTLLEKTKAADASRHALAYLFPKAERSLKTFTSLAFNRTGSFRRRRLGHSEFARAYFELGPGLAAWSRSQSQELINSSTPAVDLLHAETRIATLPSAEQSPARREMFDLLREAFSEGDAVLTQDWADALVQLSATYIEKNADASDPFRLSIVERLSLIMISGLRRLEPTVRGQIISKLIGEATDLTLICDVFRAMGGDSIKAGAQRHEQAFGIETETLRRMLLERIRTSALHGEFWTQASPRIVLWFWWGSGASEEINEFTSRSMEEDALLPILLRLPISTVRSSAGDYEHVGPEWSAVIDLEALERKADILRNSSDPLKVQLAERFIRAWERGRKF